MGPSSVSRSSTAVLQKSPHTGLEPCLAFTVFVLVQPSLTKSSTPHPNIYQGIESRSGQVYQKTPQSGSFSFHIHSKLIHLRSITSHILTSDGKPTSLSATLQSRTNISRHCCQNTTTAWQRPKPSISADLQLLPPNQLEVHTLGQHLNSKR